MLSIWNRCLNATRRLVGSGLVRLFFLPLMWDQGSYQHRSTEQQISCMQGDWGGMWLASTNQKFTNSTCSLRFVHKLHQASRWQPRSYHPEKAERDNMGKFQVLQVVREIGEGLIKKNAKTLVNF